MTAPTEMELRVLAAITKAEVEWLRQAGDALDGLQEEVSAPLPLALARAAIRAMREPTREMLLAGESAYSDFEDEGLDSEGTYQFVRPGHEAATYAAMIDAASPGG